MKNIICIIARTNSRRLPHKTIREVKGRKTIEHIIDSMKEVTHADDIYLCTSIDEDDKILLDIAKGNGIKSFAGSREKVIERILAVAEIENADNVLRVTGDNIFTDPILLDYALEKHLDTKSDYTRVERLPLGVTGEIMKVSAVKDCHSKIDPKFSEYLAVYMFNPEVYKCLTILPPEKFNLPFNTLTVDTFNDWERTNFIFDNIKYNKIYFGDIQELSLKKKIPHFLLEKDMLIKLPDNKTVTYEEFRNDYETRIKKSSVEYMSEEYYETKRNEKRR